MSEGYVRGSGADERVTRIVLTQMLPQVGFFPHNRDGTVEFRLDYKVWNELYEAAKNMEAALKNARYPDGK